MTIIVRFTIALGWLFYLCPDPLHDAATGAKHEFRNANLQDSPASAASFLPLTTITSTLTTASTIGTTTGMTKVIQVDAPVLGPLMNDGGTTSASAGVTGIGATSCQVTLMEFAFNDSFGNAE